MRSFQKGPQRKFGFPHTEKETERERESERESRGVESKILERKRLE